jgi:hypothetical protein
MQNEKGVFGLTLGMVLLSLATLAFATPGNSAPVGVWNGDMYGVRAVTLEVQEPGGKLNGTILFYLIRHNDGSPPRSAPGTPEPLIDPVFDGKVLTFKVSHKNAHPPRTLNDPPVSFRFEVSGKRANLTREGGDGEDSSCEMVKEK